MIFAPPPLFWHPTLVEERTGNWTKFGLHRKLCLSARCCFWVWPRRYPCRCCAQLGLTDYAVLFENGTPIVSRITESLVLWSSFVGSRYRHLGSRYHHPRLHSACSCDDASSALSAATLSFSALSAATVAASRRPIRAMVVPVEARRRIRRCDVMGCFCLLCPYTGQRARIYFSK